MVFTTGLKGSHVLITGGTKGIGVGLVQAFLAEGADVSYCARTVTGHEFDEYLAAAGGPQGRAVGTAVDLGEQDQVAAWVAGAAKEFGRVDAVVANASPVLMTANFPTDWETSFKIDILSLVHLCTLATPHLTRSPHPSITIVSSIAGWQPAAVGAGPYGPLKRAQHVYAKSLAAQLGPQRVRVNSVVPGTIMTPGGNAEAAEKAMPEMMAGVLEKIPLGRWGAAGDIGDAVLFLASPRAAYVTGAALVVDGGYTLFA